jgi:hypothetical protein
MVPIRFKTSFSFFFHEIRFRREVGRIDTLMVYFEKHTSACESSEEKQRAD